MCQKVFPIEETVPTKKIVLVAIELAIYTLVLPNKTGFQHWNEEFVLTKSNFKLVHPSIVHQ
jgi:hypothetical protein